MDGPLAAQGLVERTQKGRKEGAHLKEQGDLEIGQPRNDELREGLCHAALLNFNYYNSEKTEV
jgi:hypothetical protein